MSTECLHQRGVVWKWAVVGCEGLGWLVLGASSGMWAGVAQHEKGTEDPSLLL